VRAKPESKRETPLEGWAELLLTYKALPGRARGKTFMEVAGFHETLWSRILGFYLHPMEEHGLGDLVLAAFLSMAERSAVRINPERVRVIPEQVTASGKRIDLIVTGENFTVCIENKISHRLHNDLGDYARHIEQRHNSEAMINVLLSPRPIQEPPKLDGNFRNFTYQQLWNSVNERIGRDSGTVGKKWLTCLIDFMETTTRRAEKEFASSDAVRPLLCDRVGKLADLIYDIGRSVPVMPKPRIWKGTCLHWIFGFGREVKVGLDLFLHHTGWELQLVDKSERSTGYMSTLIRDPEVSIRIRNPWWVRDRVTVQEWPLEVELEEISVSVCEWVSLLQKMGSAKS
jgi:hypothetical protein